MASPRRSSPMRVSITVIQISKSLLLTKKLAPYCFFEHYRKMTTSATKFCPPASPSPQQRFFDLLQSHPRHRVRANGIPHCLRWIEEWQTFQDTADTSTHEHHPHSESGTLAFFENLATRSWLKDWHFHQAIRCVELWTREVEPSEWAQNFDWDSYCDQVQDLDNDHRNLVREIEDSALAEYPPEPDDRRPAPDEPEILAKIESDVRRKVRQRKLSINTEKISQIGLGDVHMSASLHKKLNGSSRDFRWQYLFPAAKVCAHPRTGKVARHHLHENSLQRQFKRAVDRAKIRQRATFHTLRH